MADETDTLSRQILVKVVGLLEAVAHELRSGADPGRIAGILDQYGDEIRSDLDRGSTR